MRAALRERVIGIQTVRKSTIFWSFDQAQRMIRIAQLNRVLNSLFVSMPKFLPLSYQPYDVAVPHAMLSSASGHSWVDTFERWGKKAVVRCG